MGFYRVPGQPLLTQEQIESLTLVARVLSTFLMKQRLREACAGAGAAPGAGEG